MEVITSLDNKLIKRLAKLKEKKYRDLEDIFLIETEHLIEEAYKSGLLEMLLILENEEIDFDVKKIYVTKNILNKLSFLNSNVKYIGVAHKFIPKDYGKRLLLLDNLQDPGNLGTIIRSAAAFNIDSWAPIPIPHIITPIKSKQYYQNSKINNTKKLEQIVVITNESIPNLFYWARLF